MRTLALLAALVLTGSAAAGGYGVQQVVVQPACVGCVQQFIAQPVLAQTVYSQAVVAAPVVAQRVVVRQAVVQPAAVNVRVRSGLFGRQRVNVRVR